jgi:hypothetical protein
MTIAIEIFENPAVDIGRGRDTLIVFNPVTLAAQPGYSSYLWQDSSIDSLYNIDEPGAGLYHVTVTNENGCLTTDSVYVIYEIHDLRITGITWPESSCELSASETISVEVVNNGSYLIPAAEIIRITYSVDNKKPVSEVKVLGAAINPAEIMILHFDKKHDFSKTGHYNIVASIELTGQSIPLSDEISHQVDVWGYPHVDLGSGKDTIITELPYKLDAGKGFHSYRWQDDSSGSTYTVTETGLYRVTVSNEHGCMTTDSVYIDLPVGIMTPGEYQGRISIYPNPASDILNVSIESDVYTGYTIEMFTINNKMLYKEIFINTYNVNKIINVGNFAPGIYFLRITSENQSSVFKVIIR